MTPGDGVLEVSWIEPANNGAEIEYYELQYRSDDSEPWEPDGRRITATSATIEDLENGTEYEVQVRAVNRVGESEWTASGRGTPVAPARAARRHLSASTVTPGDGVLEVSWIEPANNAVEIEYYELQYRSDDSEPWEPDGRRITATSATIEDLENGTDYEVQVRAVNRVGESEWTASGRGTPVASAREPDALSAPTVTPGDGVLEVSWIEPANNGAEIEYYELQYRSDDSEPWEPDGRRITATSATIEDLENETEYEVQVRAVNRVGESEWSESGRGTLVASAREPDALSAPTVTPGDGVLEVSWIEPANNGAEIEYYELQYRSDDSEPWEPDGRRITATSATIEDLENETEYEVQVRAVNRVGESEWSESGRGTLVASAREPDALSAPTVTPGDGVLEVSWIEPANNGAEIEYYELQYRSDDSEPWEPDGRRITATSATIEDLENETEYEVQVRAVNSVGESDWSESAEGTPMAADPDRAVLMEFYRATDGPNWATSTDWGSEKPLVDWHGVNTGQDRRVTSLVLTDNQLTGQIPQSLGRLVFLDYLNLRDNQLTGSIPDSFGQLTNLTQLNLTGNGLTGSPDALDGLTNLELLYLGNNRLESIPASLSSLTSLTLLQLHNNQLAGLIPGRPWQSRQSGEFIALLQPVGKPHTCLVGRSRELGQSGCRLQRIDRADPGLPEPPVQSAHSESPQQRVERVDSRLPEQPHESRSLVSRHQRVDRFDSPLSG